MLLQTPIFFIIFFLPREYTYRGLKKNNNAFTSAGITSSKEPHGLVRSDGKRPDGLTLVPWKGGKPLAWDVTAVCTVADSYVAATAREACAAAERAAELKISQIFWFGG